jgi:hypothetical protein
VSVRFRAHVGRFPRASGISALLVESRLAFNCGVNKEAESSRLRRYAAYANDHAALHHSIQP